MKNISKYKYLVVLAITAILASCTHEFPEAVEPTSGAADFTKMISVGNSLTAGVSNGALYDASQQASFPAILAKQMASVGGGAFNQPDINSTHGFLGSFAPDGTTPLGRLRLVGAVPTPHVPGDIPTAYSGDKTTLNNFGVPRITLGLALTPATGTPANPSENPLYTRFASSPGTSTVISDAAAALASGGTFFTFWLGSNDVLGYATGGASTPSILTSNVDFDTRYGQALGMMLAANADARGAVANIPNVSDIPFFTTIPWNAIEFDASNSIVTVLNDGLAGVNAALDGIVANLGHDAADAAARKVSYSTGKNPVLVIDETLEDLGPKFDLLQGAGAITALQRAALVPFEQARPMVEGELLVLTTGSLLGTEADGDDTVPDTPIGVAVPLGFDLATGDLAGDKWYLSLEELDEIATSITAFNSSIKSNVDANSDRLVLIDVNSIFSSLVENGASVNGSGLDASFIPPFGAFSVDGIHPNARGYAFVANRFIEGINAKWGSDIPLANPNDYAGNELPE